MVILGSTGMLGQALIQEAASRGVEAIGVSRTSADVCIDVLDLDKLSNFLLLKRPNVIINCIAITDLEACENDLGRAYMVNSHLVAKLVGICKEIDAYLVHISTDHYYPNDLDRKHKEEDRVDLVNNYAITKFAGEQFALSYDKALAVRTNIVGFRSSQAPTFIEWVLSSLDKGKKMTLFQDFYTSSIDVNSFAKILFSIISRNQPVYGLLNIASSEVASKAVFIEKVAKKFGYNKCDFRYDSVHSLKGVKRAESLGLDVSKVEKILGERMPTVGNVIYSLFSTWKKHDKNQ